MNVIKNILGNKRFGGKNDLDFDGVPNRRDCQPRNTMRQDAVTRDIEYEEYMRKRGIKKGPNCPKCSAETYENYNFCNQCRYKLK